MAYYKIPLDADLSETSYRCHKTAEEVGYIEYNEGYVGEDWQEVSAADLVDIFGYNPFEEEEETPSKEPTDEELIQAEILLNQMDIIATQKEHDVILSEILLNQMEGLINE